MKEIIVICGTIALGCTVFALICGPGDTLQGVSCRYMSDMVSVYGGAI